MRFTKIAQSAILLLLLLFLSPQRQGYAQSNIDVAVHYVEGTPAEDGNSYNVTVYLSVVDGLGFPIRDLTSDMFWVTEDALDVGIQNFKIVENEPVNIVLAVDISEGMSGISNFDIKSALKAFLSTLKSNDQVAILTFDNKVESQIAFGIDRIASADFLDLIPGQSDTGTCMYDAAHSAIQMASTLASGNRAVILLTDGIDQTATGAICSVRTVDDVVNLASSGGTRTPVFIVELGGTGDNNSLRRIADVTGGLYLHSFTARDLDNVAQQLSDDLRSQYIMTYQSFAGAGPHALSVGVNHAAGQAIDTRNFVLPPPPTRIAFVTPQEGEVVGDTLKAEISLLSQGEAIERVAFEINGTVVDTDDTKPYELTLDMRQYPPGPMTVSAIAYGVNNSQLSSSILNLVHSAAMVVPTDMASTPVVFAPQEKPRINIKPVMILGIVLGGLGIFTIVLLVSMLLHQQQKDRTAQEVEEIDNNLFAQVRSTPAVEDVYRTVKAEKRAETKPETFGTLLVEASDDAGLVGHLFYIISESTTLGRSADNDIPFPKDNPVSRQHAEIFFKGGRLYLKEILSTDAAGEVKSPKYGTFINQRSIGPDPVLLKTGDEILLGKRVRLKFQAGEKLAALEASTFDDMTSDGDDYDIDKTRTIS